MPYQKRLSVAWPRCKSLLSTASYFRSVLFAAMVLYTAFLSGIFSPQVQVSLKMSSNIGHLGELFFASNGTSYSEREKRRFPVIPNGMPQEYLIDLRGTAVSKIRIDPGSGQGSITIHSLRVQDGAGSFVVPLLALQRSQVVRHIDAASLSERGFSFNSTGYDPFIGIDLPRSFGTISVTAASVRIVAITLVSLLTWLLIEIIFRWAYILLAKYKVFGELLGHVNSMFGDRDVLVFTPAILLSFTALLLAGFLYVSLGLNQSSIGVWEGIYPYQPVSQSVDFGTAKGVRSDEWRVQTPWILNQVQQGSPVTNPNVGGESSPLVASLPVSGLAGVPHFKFMGFRFLDLEYGFSWFWAYKTFVTLGSLLWLLLLLTRGNLFVSALGTAWVYGSSYVQWWFSSNLPEILAAFAIGVVGAVYLLFSSNRKMISVGALLCIYSACNVMLNLYPPFVIPLFYLGISLVLGYALRRNNSLHALSQQPVYRAAATGLAVLCVVAYISYLYLLVQDSVQVMRSTLYPGQRLSEAGGVPFGKLLSGYFEAFRLSESDYPFAPSNASEASSFVWIFPFAFFAFSMRSWLRRDLVFVLPLCFVLLVCATWIHLDLAGQLEQSLQAAGWSLVTPKRTILALGVGSIILVCVLLAAAQQNRTLLTSSRFRLLATLSALVLICLIGYRYHRVEPQFFTIARVSAGVLASSLLVFGILFYHRTAMVIGTAIFVIPALMANPLVSGTSALTQKPILVAAVKASSLPESYWMVIGDIALTQGLKAVGLNVFAGSQYLPNKRWISVLDPSKRYENVWNRYATIHVKSKPGTTHAAFHKMRADQYRIELDICSVDVKKLGITHVAFTTAVPAHDYACLSELPSPTNSGVRLFQFVR